MSTESSNDPNPERPGRKRAGGSGAARAAEQVGVIIAAAEETAERITSEAEDRSRERIAEGERAAEKQIRAAAQEAEGIVGRAREKAEQVTSKAEQSKQAKAKEAKSLLNKARQDAERVRKEARDDAERMRSEAQAAAAAEREAAAAGANELLSQARITSSDVQSEGLELVGNLRSMSDSLRANAERLLRDVQLVHSRMVAELDRVDGGANRTSGRVRARRAPGGTPPSRSVDEGAATQVFRSENPRSRRERPPQVSEEGDVLDVPEFIPPS
ncbi:MAG: hypothetical protein JOZ73_12645 [Solirubrobacterales bacterium]|nr:hypothetical protein [Solirubrobacterales bacterium]